MFHRLGQFAARRAPISLLAWVLVLGTTAIFAPKWLDVVENGEFAFLPDDAPSVLANTEFRRTFPEDIFESSIVIVARRASSAEGLLEEDELFLYDHLIPGVYKLAELPLPEDAPDEEEAAVEEGAVVPLVGDIKTFRHKHLGDLFESSDGRASLIVMELTTEFLDQQNFALVESVEELLRDIRRKRGDDGKLVIPPGLDLSVSGTATFGRDMLKASTDSAKSTERWTVILVIFLLIIIYRAPLLALIPLLTVAFSTWITLNVLSLMAQAGWISLFNGIEVYVTVVVYGAGVDYCLFLIARYREELDHGRTIEDAVCSTLDRVGAALTASAGTVMCGIGMMMFAEFGKFKQAGFSITFGLAICLTAALTLTPAMLRLFGKWAFWPQVPTEKVKTDPGWPSHSDWVSRLRQADWVAAGWDRLAQQLTRHPWAYWLGSIALMMPFAIIGVIFFSNLSYGLLSELPDEAPSVQGTKMVQQHFAAGEIAPVTVLIRAANVDFSEKANDRLIADLTDKLKERADELTLANVRSLARTKGLFLKASPFSRASGKARAYYISRVDPHVTRIDLIFQNDPFSNTSIAEYRAFEGNLREIMPPELTNAELSFKGETPSISDLKTVTDSDQIRIDILVLGGVYLILVVLLRRPGICAYLIVSVFFSYLATLGVTFTVFYLLDPEGFTGLDWKVPMFLFTILIAVGEDYNIFLMTRIDEESVAHGKVKGVTVALERTGSIISSCGIIMAGTFSSLLTGTLVGMHQLGFALAFGVLLDTFLVRPVLVPAFLVLLHGGHFRLTSDAEAESHEAESA